MIKRVSLCTAVFLAMLGLCCYKSDASNYETFIRYDLKTGETSEINIPGEPFDTVSEKEQDEIVMTPEEAQPLPMTRAGNMGQELITDEASEPYKWIGKIECTDYNGSTGDFTRTSGSGALIGEKHVLTAAHVVYQKDKKRPWQNIHFYAGVEEVVGGVKVPYGNMARAVYVPEAYQNEAADKLAVIHDYAVIEFEFGFPKNYGHFSVYVSNRLDSFDPSVHSPFCTANIAGFPASGVSKAGLYKANGEVTIWKNYVLDYELPMFPGQSGGPIYRKINGKYRLLGINCQMVFNDNGTFKCSRGRCITPTLRNFINKYVVS